MVKREDLSDADKKIFDVVNRGTAVARWQGPSGFSSYRDAAASRPSLGSSTGQNLGRTGPLSQV